MVSNTHRNGRMERHGAFTLVEILVVILIIGLLFVFLVPKIDTATDKARETAIKTDFRAFQTAFEAVAKEQGGLGARALSRGTGDGAFEVLLEKINYYLDPALQLGYYDPDGTAFGTWAGGRTARNGVVVGAIGDGGEASTYIKGGREVGEGRLAFKSETHIGNGHIGDSEMTKEVGVPMSCKLDP